jgi:CelD/BcsL family acetyltransferase involved in cellulose biosynthesis
VSVAATVEEATAVHSDWGALLAASGQGNPFLTPEWQIPWARHFTEPGELQILLVHNGDELVAIAPLYRRVTRVGPLRFARTRLLGSGGGSVLTELPQIVSLPEWHRRSMRLIVAHVMGAEPRSDWVELTLAPTQGWLEPEWIPESVGPPAVVMASGVAATVVVALPTAHEALQSQLKPSLRRSIRRGRNRLARAGIDCSFEVVDQPGESLRQAVDRLVSLHRARAQVADHVAHADSFAHPDEAGFLHEAAQGMAALGQLKICSLVTSTTTIATVLVLRVNGSAYFSVSGTDPDYWEFGPMTLLLRECLDDAIANGDRSANLLRGPNYAKLRWAEELEVHHHFSLVSGRRRSHLAFAAYAPLRTGSEFWVRARQRRGGDAEAGGALRAAARRMLRREHGVSPDP